jgi:polyhydroxybutyrate depolymerase
VSSPPYDFTHRNYALQLPQNYQQGTAYPLVLEGGGCAGGNTESGGGFSVGQPANAAIQVGLSYVSSAQNGRCFADGGLACASNPADAGGPSTGGAASLPLCVNNPEMAYINAVIADIESKYCIDKGNVFIGGYSSGAWESMTMGCALADKIRAIGTADGGIRLHRPTCVGPVAALMMAGQIDTVNPIGPIPPAQYTPYLDSTGSGPERDDILSRNGCVGTATTPYETYANCVQYTGCPAAFPVVWCDIPGVGHVNPGNGAAPPFSIYWNFFSKLPPHP